ncbi:hybrid sensor histidine kinase/response regulator [Geitlerinema splendidum]|nr:hybrid sensor histidine kinase/response regulator [Geitlerinema splendidum]
MNPVNRNSIVLIVDDEFSGFEVIEAHLFREAYEVVYLDSAKLAIQQLENIKPDVILLDVMMPELDGIEACRQIKAKRHCQQIPIIMVTALNAPEDLARAFAAGADDFITKPVSGVELRARVRSMLRIKQQYDALEATLHLREDLSNMIVHDLRNPLASILLSSELLLQYGVEGKTQEKVKTINLAARQLNSMINDLLILAKMESGQMLLNLVEVDLKQLVSKTIAQFEAIAQSRNQRLVSHLPELDQPILADASLLSRVLDNLLSNAIKFSPRRSTITLETQYLNCPPPQQVMIRTLDEGPGIDEAVKERIFDKYEVGTLMSGVTQVGLGLAFCKMVIEAHQGSISVEANQPKGSIFTITL